MSLDDKVVFHWWLLRVYDSFEKKTRAFGMLSISAATQHSQKHVFVCHFIKTSKQQNLDEHDRMSNEFFSTASSKDIL
ncbi:CLUMA_CG001751, isoform A [Clunio marinus]|uniref:CLUMA_CG001751, isoform A n=1 Tax=Clunio marinus TaxID=568069 RepID=A0A1J1HIX5_9DIPT|nr:CLUMA_CG001751, isoform A [Clunio marinus]